MRHGKKVNHLGRTASHRKAMLSNMAASLILHKRITTTVAKAKALRKYVEPLLTRSKTDTTHSRRVVFSYLQNKEAVTELFNAISDRIAERPGGYTRIIKLGTRLGDNAETCMIELVDYNDLMLQSEGSNKSRRRRRKKKSSTDAEAVVTSATVEEGISESTVEVEENTPEVIVSETSDDNGTEISSDNDVEEPKKTDE